MNLFDPLSFKSGAVMPNRFMLAPLTNLQSHDDGQLSDEEYKWLSMRSQGGFGLTMTCAAFAEIGGKGFVGQLGAVGEAHFDGLKRMADGIKEHGNLAILQIVHGGMRTLEKFTGQQPVCPSDNEETGARAMTHDEVKATHKAFVDAAILAQKAGFDGVELHGAHGYLLCQFLSSEINKRDDEYGGSLENRTRLIDEIIRDIRAACGYQFTLGLRLSPSRFGMVIEEVMQYYERLCAEDQLDFIDMSLWDVFEEVDEGSQKGRRLIDIFTSLERGNTKLTAAGKINTGADVLAVMQAGADFVALGRAGIIHHDYPKRFQADAAFQPFANPVSRAHLAAEGLGPTFIEYMSTWKGFVEPA